MKLGKLLAEPLLHFFLILSVLGKQKEKVHQIMC